MCGIVGVVRRPNRREPPAGAELVAAMEAALHTLDTASATDPAAFDDAAAAVEGVDAALRGVPGVRTLLRDRSVAVALEDRARRIGDRLARVESELDEIGF